MAKSKENTSYYDTLHDGFLSALKKAQKPEEKNVHQLRVSIKHFRALIKLSERLNKKLPCKQTIQLIRPTFQSAGHYRSNQINIALLKKYKLNAKHVQLLEKKQQRFKKDLKKNLENFPKKIFLKKTEPILLFLNKSSLDTITTKCLLFIDQLKIKCKKKLSAQMSDKDLHSVRKNLKTIKTNLQLLVHLNSTKLFKTYLKEINEVEVLIGEWHDMALFCELLEKFKKLQPKNPKQEALLLSLKTQNNLAKQNVIKTLSSYLH